VSTGDESGAEAASDPSMTTCDETPAAAASQPDADATFRRLLVNSLVGGVTSSFLWFALTFWLYLETARSSSPASSGARSRSRPRSSARVPVHAEVRSRP